MVDPYINKETINKSRNLEPEPVPSVADMSDVETDPKGRGRGKDRGRSRVRREAQLGAAASRSGSKRARHSSADEEEIDTDVVLDTLLGCFRRDDSLLDKFMNRLLLLPEVESIMAGYTSKSASAGHEPIDPETVKCLNDSVQKLTSAVNKLQTELAKSTEKCTTLEEKCDDLEQYSRRTNIIISNVPVNNSVTLETQVCNILNAYVTPPVEPTDIDRTHRIYRKASQTTSDKPPDIIVKFLSYRTKARILTQDPMEKLRADNDKVEDKHKIYISEDLTKTRKSIFFSTRQLKKKKLIKDTFPRDGRIVVKIKVSGDIKTWHITKDSDLKAMCNKYKLPLIKPKSNETTRADIGEADHSASMDTDPPPSQPTSPSLLGSGDPFRAHPGASNW